MLGKKNYEEKLYMNFQLSQRIPKENFYRQLKEFLDLNFIYKLVKPYYGKEGQKSIDPVVFFKLMLVSYLESINVEGFIPLHGQYEGTRKGFVYEPEQDRWRCRNGKYVTFRKQERHLH